ncbi:phage tail protein [Streptomyces sp. M19]
MSRAAVPGLPSRHPIGALLPALYADDDFAQRFTAGLDTVLAPVFATLDNLPGYLDPGWRRWTSSPGWRRGWAPPTTPVAPELRREAVVRAVELHRWRGTRHGLVERLRLTLGVHADVTGDGARCGPVPGRRPAAGAAHRGGGPGVAGRDPDVDESRVREIVRALCPVHVSCRVEVLPGPPVDEEGGDRRAHVSRVRDGQRSG